MIANIISKHSFSLIDTVTVSEYELSFNGDYSGKSQFVCLKKVDAEEDDFIIVLDGTKVFQGIITSIETEKGKDSCEITAIEMPKLFDQKIILANESLLQTGVEDFIADQITSNFISNEDELVNIDYLSVTAKTHTPISAKVQTEDGIYNLCTYIGNALTNYGVFIDFEFADTTLNVTIENREQTTFDIDTSIVDVSNLEEVREIKAITKLTVLWNGATRHFFLRTNRTITENMSDPDRAKGTTDIIISEAETETEMIREVEEKFASNTYNHKIGFDVIPTSKLIPESDLFIGHKCRVKTDTGIRDSIISGINRSNDRKTVSVTLGNLKVTLIEKLKGVDIK